MGLKVRVLLFFSFVLVGCAQVRPLEGGGKDEQAPVPYMADANPALGSTNVRPAIIRIPFDEYIKLNSPSKNINVVPELPTKPKYEIKGKTLIITLDPTELLDNTTYSFVFNRAISDLNEANDTTFTYVFSTGQFIDSLSHSVLLIDAATLGPVEGALIGLYVPSDTLDPYTQKPRYLAQSNKLGEASFEYLGQQNFVVFAYDLKGSAKLTEDAPIAFRQDLLALDTLKTTDTLFMFAPVLNTTKGRVLSKGIDGPGRIALRTNFPFSPAEILVQSGDQYIDFMVEETFLADSVVLWIRATENTIYDVMIPFQDTAFNVKVSSKKKPTKLSKVANNLIKDELGIQDTLTLVFDYPILRFDASRFNISTDDRHSLSDVSISVDNHRKLRIVGGFSSDLLYQVSVLPNAVQFYDESFFSDSIQTYFKRLGTNKYANLELVLEDKPDKPLLVFLVSGGEIIAEKRVAQHQEVVRFELLPPGEYIVKVVVDENGNGQWDTGSWVLRQQPENVIWFRQAFTLRANWDTKQPLGFQ